MGKLRRRISVREQGGGALGDWRADSMRHGLLFRAHERGITK
jgi:hypothetical protein